MDSSDAIPLNEILGVLTEETPTNHLRGRRAGGRVVFEQRWQVIDHSRGAVREEWRPLPVVDDPNELTAGQAQRGMLRRLWAALGLFKGRSNG